MSFLKSVFFNESGNLNLYGKVLAIILTILVTRIVLKVVQHFIKKSLEKGRIISQNKTWVTIIKLVSNTVSFVLYFLALLQILSILGVKTSSLLATAGIGGLVVGLGAQSLIQDVISGFFIMLEEKYQVGDYVIINGVDGLVKELGLKTTTLEGYDGAIHMINNGSISLITNRDKVSQWSVIDIPFSYQIEPEDARALVEEVVGEMNQEEKDLIDSREPLTCIGITDFQMGFYKLTVRGKVKSSHQWATERKFRKKIFDKMKEKNYRFPTYGEANSHEI